MDNKIQAVIFDLDGVVVSTDKCHYEAWKQLADEEGIYFDRKINERLRGVSRMQSLEIILERSSVSYNEVQKKEMADRKNSYYREMIGKLTAKDILPGVEDIINNLKIREIKIAIGSSSRNSPLILEKTGLNNIFDAVVDGNSIERSKPDPEVFLKASTVLEIPPVNCLVVEDADAGVEAALSGGMRVLAVGSASENRMATSRAGDLSEITADMLLCIS